jgi:hypothetical protein
VIDDEFEEFKLYVEDTYNALADAEHIMRSVDTIPYSECFDRVFVRVSSRYPCTRNELFMTLMNLRKQGKCPAPKGRRRGPDAA